MTETKEISVESLRMLVETAAATLGLLLAAEEYEAVTWLAERFQEMTVASLKEMGVDLDRGLRVKVSDN